MRAGGRTNREAIQEKVRRWEPVLRGLREHPEVSQRCPFCHAAGVKVSWSLFNSPLAKRMRITWHGWCEHCAEQLQTTVEVEPPKVRAIRGARAEVLHPLQARRSKLVRRAMEWNGRSEEQGEA